MTELTMKQQRPAHPWGPGQSGNPAGRPRGSRNRLSEDFVAALYDDFQDHGSAAIAACRATKPDVYLRVISSLLPRDVSIKVQQLDDLTDDQLVSKLAVLTETTKPLLARLPVLEGSVSICPSLQIVPRRRPFQNRVERRAERLAPIGQTIFDLGRHLMMDDPAHDTIPLHLPELLDEHFLRDRWDRTLKIGKAPQRAVEEVKEDEKLPTPL
jgi:hypothetical protein